LLLGELVAEAEAIVEQTKADDHGAAGLLLREMHCQLVVVVADGAALAPYRLPSLIHAVPLGVCQAEAVVERCARVGVLAHLLTELCVATAGQFEAQATGKDHLPA